ncbi:MAG: peptide ABC transporter substrate-binding protein [Clostridia bacterium]|nr:peptide ABC transporter substrate-binding protein [Clostridia bacterium]
MKRSLSFILSLALLAVSLFTLTPSLAEGTKSINVAITSDPEINFDDIGDSPNGFITSAVREGLTRQGQNGTLTEGLAESYEHNDDYTQWTFHLRESGYSDGTPVTADDFVYAITAQLDGTYEVGYPDFLYEIKNARGVVRGTATADELGVKALDEKTVVFELEYPVTYFPQLITHPMHFGYSRAHGESVGAENVGLEADTLIANGPYYIESWVHDDNLVLKKNPYYWNRDNIAIDEIHVFIIPDETTRVNLFLNGELDVVDFDASRVGAISAAGFTPLTYNNGRTTYVSFNLTSTGVKNQKIRQALSAAIDRESLVAGVVRNGSTPADGFVPIGLAGDETLSFREVVGPTLNYPYDEANAAKLFAEGLQEEGIQASDITLSLLTSNATENATVSAALQQIWQEAFGITINVDVLDSSSYRTRRNNYEYDIVFLSWGADWNDATNFLSGYEQTEDHDAPKYYSEAFNEAYLKGVYNTDIHDRVLDLGRSEAILLEDAAIVPIYYTSQYYAVSSRLTGVERRAVIPYLDFYFADVK